ncbi:hypothetical protein QWZ06_17165 [Chryseobacterium tructae]|uniref:Lipoprotein n=1 Tax=Chryseobacterium tructae TaxID=1037380 RepID=A0ABV7Y1B9_9FLAO|nr:hypothetical protein [Chryseobacterium tructae]MDN3693890.1 hypothetical protein [Chryseobacterium tructae]
MKKILFLVFIFLVILVSTKILFFPMKTKTKSDINANTELIFSKELDKQMSVECYVNSDNDFYYWEFNRKGKENKTIDKLKISKLKLGEYSRYANRPKFYNRFRILSVFKDADNLVFLIDKFGQVDVHIYSLIEKNSKTIIPVKKYKLSPMDVVLLGEDFQDVKIVDNTIYTLSVYLRGGGSMYYFSKVDLNNKKVMEGFVNVSTEDFVTNPNNETKPIVQLEDGNYKETGSDFKFSLFNNNQIKIEENKVKSFVTKIDFKPPHIDKNEDVNKIIEYLP